MKVNLVYRRTTITGVIEATPVTELADKIYLDPNSQEYSFTINSPIPEPGGVIEVEFDNDGAGFGYLASLANDIVVP